MDALTDAEAQLWASWTAAQDTLAQISAEITEATGLSEPDVTVLMCLQKVDGGHCRQSELAAVTGWHRSRLSHHLRRMEERGLVARTGLDGGVEVRLTTMGRAAAARARPAQAAAVRRHLVERLSARDRERLRHILDRLTDPGR